MLWKSFNSLFNFLVLEQFHHILQPRNFIVIVTNFCHIMVVISSPQLHLGIKVFPYTVLAKPPVKMKIQLFWSKGFTVSTVDLTAICMSWHVCKLTNILDLAFWVESPDLLWVFSFHILRHERNWFVIQEHLLLFSLVCDFWNGLIFFWCFSKFLRLRQSKSGPNIWQYLAV